MFNSLSNAIDNASKEIDAIKNNYIEKRQNIAVNVQKEMEEELHRLKTQVALKDYSPIEHHNKIVSFNSEYDSINVAENCQYEEVKNKLFEQLLTLMDVNTVYNPKPYPVTEMYKIISSWGHDKGNYVCRVWFTLIPIKKWNCIPGDPIRVEWKLNHGYLREDDNEVDVKYDVVSERTSEGIKGLKIPEMANNGQVTQPCKFFDLDDFDGEQDERVKRWKQWVETNRPIA